MKIMLSTCLRACYFYAKLQVCFKIFKDENIWSYILEARKCKDFYYSKIKCAVPFSQTSKEVH